MKYKLINKSIQNDYAKELFMERGIEDMDSFLHPSIENLQDFFALDNISAGIKLIQQTIYEERPFALIADCDCDGCCATTIIYQYLRRLNPKKSIEVFVHSGKQHGFEDLMDRIRDRDWSLILCPDAGSNDGELIAQLNCPVLVLDHHILNEDATIPPNMVLINNQTSAKYINKELCGAGVTWQFCRALDDALGNDWAFDYIDLCAVAIIGDMMSLLSYENQYIIQTGLRRIKNEMLHALIDKQDYSMGGKLTPTNIAFYIVPLINAMIRAGSQDEKERMYWAFLEPDKLVESHKRGAKDAMERLCVESVRECVNAKSRQDREKEKFVEQLEVKIFNENLLDNKILFVKLSEDEAEFPPELNGLVAMVLAARHKIPVMLGRENSEGYVRGSIRAPDNTALTSFRDYLLGTGLMEYVSGHDSAAGYSLKNKNISSLLKTANDDFAQVDFGDNIYDVNFIRRANEKDIQDIIYDVCSYDFVYGQQNPEPVIAITDLCVNMRDVKIIGKNADTVRIEKNGITYIKFKAKDMIEKISKYDGGIKLTLVGRGNINNWMGQEKPQIFIVDYDIEDMRFAF